MSLRIWEPCNWIISWLLWILPPMMQSHILLMCVAFSSFACLFIYCISVLVKCWLLFYYYSSLNELNSFMKYMKRRNNRANWKIWYLVSGYFCLLLFFAPGFSPQFFPPWNNSQSGPAASRDRALDLNLCQLLYFYLLGPKFLSIGGELNRSWSRVESACLFHWLYNLPFLVFCFLFLYIGWLWPKLCGFLRTGID